MLTCCETTLSQLPELLEILLAHLPEEMRRVRVEQTVQLYERELRESESHRPAAERELTRHEIFHFERNGKMIGGGFSMLRPDGTLLALQPVVLPSEPESSLRLVYETMLEYAAESQTGMAILLVDFQQTADESALAAFGFKKTSELLNLNAERMVFPTHNPAKRLQFIPYKNEQWPEMVALVDKTYENTLDFPFLTGKASAERILSGYQESHAFNPSLWFFVEFQSKIIGVLLLTQIEQTEHLELTYIGLTQEFRGLDLSREVVQFSQFIAYERHCSHVLVSVDAANIPALSAYLHSGFHIHDQKEIYVRFL